MPFRAWFGQLVHYYSTMINTNILLLHGHIIIAWPYYYCMHAWLKYISPFLRGTAISLNKIISFESIFDFYIVAVLRGLCVI
jgi:hypothetical protein